MTLPQFKTLRQDREAIAAARTFDTSPRKKTTRTFFQLLQQLLDPNKTAMQIAEDAGICSSALGGLYTLHFARFVGPKTLKERAELMLTIRAQARTTQLVQGFGSDGIMRQVVEAARAAGLTVSPMVRPAVNEKYAAKAYSRSAVIGGKKCSIRHLTKCRRVQPNYPHQYANTSVHRDMLALFDAVVFLIDVPGYESRTLVVPTADLLRDLFAKSEKKLCRVFIPILKVETGPNSRIDFGKYENAWATLRGISKMSGT